MNSTFKILCPEVPVVWDVDLPAAIFLIVDFRPGGMKLELKLEQGAPQGAVPPKSLLNTWFVLDERSSFIVTF